MLYPLEVQPWISNFMHFIMDKQTFPFMGKTISTQIAKALGSTSIRHPSDTFTSDRYLIDIDPMAFAIWAGSRKIRLDYIRK